MAINKDDYKPTALELIASHPVAAAAAAALAAGASAGASVFLPVLTGTLAARRHEERMGRFINDVTEDLKRLERRLDELDDAQYQLIGDAISCAFQTVSEEKLEYLRRAIRNGLSTDIDPVKSAYISRCIRDISPEEAAFLISNIDEPAIAIVQAPQAVSDALVVAAGSGNELVVSGLLSLGLLAEDDSMGGRGYLYWKSSARLIYDFLNE